MNRKEAIRKLEYSKKAYQRLIDEKVDSGKLIGKDVRGEWKADTPLDEAYKSMIDALEMAIKALKQELCEDAISRQAVLDMMQMRMSGKELYKAVYDLPPVNPQPCGDLISRKAILEEFENDQYHLEFCKEHHIERSISMEMVRIRLHDLPLVNPQPKMGRWIDIDDGVECDKCGKWYPHAPIAKNEIKFCSECGAKMSEPQERIGEE